MISSSTVMTPDPGTDDLGDDPLASADTFEFSSARGGAVYGRAAIEAGLRNFIGSQLEANSEHHLAMVGYDKTPEAVQVGIAAILQQVMSHPELQQLATDFNSGRIDTHGVDQKLAELLRNSDQGGNPFNNLSVGSNELVMMLQQHGITSSAATSVPSQTKTAASNGLNPATRQASGQPATPTPQPAASGFLNDLATSATKLLESGLGMGKAALDFGAKSVTAVLSFGAATVKGALSLATATIGGLFQFARDLVGGAANLGLTVVGMGIGGTLGFLAAPFVAAQLTFFPYIGLAVIAVGAAVGAHFGRNFADIAGRMGHSTAALGVGAVGLVAGGALGWAAAPVAFGGLTGALGGLASVIGAVFGGAGAAGIAVGSLSDPVSKRTSPQGA